MTSEVWQRRLTANGALVFLLGLVAGFPFAFIILGKVALWPIPGELQVTMPGDVRGWRMAHLEGILNGLTLFAVAAVLPLVRLRGRELAFIGWSLLITAWGNIVASLIGPLAGGSRGLEVGHGPANDIMFVLFVAAVGAIIWAMILICRAALRGAES